VTRPFANRPHSLSAGADQQATPDLQAAVQVFGSVGSNLLAPLGTRSNQRSGSAGMNLTG